MDKFLIDYIAGVAGGVAVVIVGHPFDTTKTRLQTSPKGFYSSTFDCIRKTISTEGFYGFYSGMMSPLVGQMFFRAASFSVFHTYVTSISKDNELVYNRTGELVRRPPTSQQLLMAGAVTGAAISVIEAPIDLIKTKLQIQIFSKGSTYSTVPQCVRYLVSRHGVRALWQGWSGTLLRNIPANAMFFPVNELVKGELARRSHRDPSTLLLHQRLTAGACAGLCYWTLTYPLDVIKGRMQAVPFEDRRSWFRTVGLIYRNGGWREFFRGFSPCAARAIPACAALFATTDIVRYELQGVL